MDEIKRKTAKFPVIFSPIRLATTVLNFLWEPFTSGRSTNRKKSLISFLVVIAWSSISALLLIIVSLTAFKYLKLLRALGQVRMLVTSQTNRKTTSLQRRIQTFHAALNVVLWKSSETKYIVAGDILGRDWLFCYQLVLVGIGQFWNDQTYMMESSWKSSPTWN